MFPTEPATAANVDPVVAITPPSRTMQPPLVGSAATVTETTTRGSNGDAQGELRVPVYEEELVVETRSHEMGHIRVHKSVETVEQQLTAPIVREEVTVERIPADQYDASAPANPDETVIPVVEERLVVETRAVVVEYVRIRTRRVTEEQDVRAPIRREVVTVEELPTDGDASVSRPLLHETQD